MSVGLLIALALLAGLAAFILAPLFRADSQEKQTESSANTEMQDLQSRHDMALSALSDLEDDRNTGKIGDDDYHELKNKLTAQAIEVMKRIDELDGAHPSIARRRQADKP